MSANDPERTCGAVAFEELSVSTRTPSVALYALLDIILVLRSDPNENRVEIAGLQDPLAALTTGPSNPSQWAGE